VFSRLWYDANRRRSLLEIFEIVAPANQTRDLQTRTAAFALPTDCGRTISKLEYKLYHSHLPIHTTIGR
jgi:hypothetical protein